MTSSKEQAITGGCGLFATADRNEGVHMSFLPTAEFVERYNKTWRLERIGYRMPSATLKQSEHPQAAYVKHLSEKPGALQQ